MAKKHLAIIGHGMAGSRLLDELLTRHATSRYTITIYGEEPGHAYNRILLSKGAGRRRSRRHPPAGRRLARRRRGEGRAQPPRRQARHRAPHAESVRRPARAVRRRRAGHGRRPFIPPITGTTTADGKPKPGVFAYRTSTTCCRCESKSRPGDAAVVLGGGLLGLEAAKALVDIGLHVTVVHLAPVLMDTQLDEHGGRMLQRLIEQTGIFVRCGRTISEVTGEGQVRGVKLDDGTFLAADMVVMACGIRPRVDLAKASGIPVNRAVLVNDTLAHARAGCLRRRRVRRAPRPGVRHRHADLGAMRRARRRAVRPGQGDPLQRQQALHAAEGGRHRSGVDGPDPSRNCRPTAPCR